MRLAVIRRRCWPDALRALGHECVELPELPAKGCFDATLEERLEHGRLLRDLLDGESIDALIATNGDGLLFVDDPGADAKPTLLHHVLNVPLISHWTESLRVLFKGLNRSMVLDALGSPTWHKGVFVRSHLDEMRWLNIPNCFYLPLAANEQSYDTSPPLVDYHGPKVLFAGNVQTRYFFHADGVDTRSQLIGALALAGTGDGSVSTFLESYCRLVPEAMAGKSLRPEKRNQVADHYYANKLFYTASRNVAYRDRFILTLREELGDEFLLVGPRQWSESYRLEPVPPVSSSDYQKLIRSTPICVNMSNGDNDTGLNLRHFEITALGGFLLSYHHDELAEFFEIGEECDSFRNETELLEKVRFYVENRERRNQIAKAGQQKTLSRHLMRHRGEVLLDHVLSESYA